MQRLLFVARLLKLLSSHCGLNHNFLIFHFLRVFSILVLIYHVSVITNVCFKVRTTNCHLSGFNYYLQIEIFQNMKFYSQNSWSVPPCAAKAPRKYEHKEAKSRNEAAELWHRYLGWKSAEKSGEKSVQKLMLLRWMFAAALWCC